MATARVTVNMAWFVGLPETSEMRAMLNACHRVRSGERSEPNALQFEIDALDSVLSSIPDEGVAFVSYRANRGSFYAHSGEKHSRGGITVEVIGPGPAQERQVVMVFGAPHSVVRRNFFAIWNGERTPFEVGLPFEQPSGLRFILGRSLKEQAGACEALIILDALKQCGWSRGRAAHALGINRTTLFNKMQMYGLMKRPAESSAGF